MPLKAGSSRAAVSTQTSRNQMPAVLNGMAVRAEHLKIAWLVVVVIAVLVMNTQDLGHQGVPAPFAGEQLSPSLQIFPNCGKGRLPAGEDWFVDAGPAAVLSFLGRRGLKGPSAVLALHGHGSLEVHRPVVTPTRTIPGYFFSAADDGEVPIADQATHLDSVVCVLPLPGTTSRAKPEGLSSIGWDPHGQFAMEARQHAA